jgi:hypothetical protein
MRVRRRTTPGLQLPSPANKESEISEGVGFIERFYHDVVKSGNISRVEGGKAAEHWDALPPGRVNQRETTSG